MNIKTEFLKQLIIPEILYKSNVFVLLTHLFLLNAIIHQRVKTIIIIVIIILINRMLKGWRTCLFPGYMTVCVTCGI